MERNIIEIRDLTTKFGNTIVHNKINLTIQKGDIYTILGKSGSGKSTILREILMLNENFTGTIKVLGTDIKKANDSEKDRVRKSWGVMFQAASLFTSLTIGENISIPLLENTKLSKKMIEKIALFKLSLVGLERSVYEMYPSELSGGMRKKAALSRALILDPQILMLDEPTSGLDPVSAEDFDNTIRNLNQLLGLTVIIITHDLNTFFNIATRACILGDKKVLAEGNPNDIINLDDEWIKKMFFGERGIKFQWKQKQITP